MPNSVSDAADARLDRLLGFAFAPAELLAEIGPDGNVTWAAGAYASRFGRGPESFIGKPFARLIAPADQAALAITMANAAMRGRIAPTVLRLSDAARTPASFAALAMPGGRPRLCATLGPLPVPLPAPPGERLAGAQAGGPAGLDEAGFFAREAASRLRAGVPSGVGLVEIVGWSDLRERLSGAERRRLVTAIGDAFAGGAGSATLTGELGDGRYGVIGDDAVDLPAIVRRIGHCLRCAAGRDAQITGLDLADPAAPGGPQMARALRFALGRFAAGGAAAARECGIADGLARFVAQTEGRRELLADTIARRRFNLAYQPVVTLADRRLHHYEALLRPLPLAALPGVTTQEFVTLAEMTGLSEALDLAVLATARAALLSAPGVAIAVNLSGLSMQSAAFREGLPALLDPAVARRLLVELTETVEIEDFAAAAATVSQLRASGVPVCIDDFGAGAAAFRYLREFQVDFVKIDGSYVRAAVSAERERSFIASMVSLAASVNARVIAESVETEEQASLMRELGAELGQGWLFGRPGRLSASA
jgi:EAL domain-containing protein (putative c-di-GMP-specific phosphodiesterase class I)